MNEGKSGFQFRNTLKYPILKELAAQLMKDSGLSKAAASKCVDEDALMFYAQHQMLQKRRNKK